MAGRIFGNTNETAGGAAPAKTEGIVSPSGRLNEPTGGWADASNYLGNVMNKGLNKITDIFGKLMYWENRGSQAIETGLGKLAGVPEAQNLDPFKVLTGKEQTDISGRDIIHGAIKNIFGKTPDKWYYNAPEWAAGLGMDMATDPFMYLTMGEAGIADAFRGTERLGSFSEEGVKAIKEELGAKSLIDAAPDSLEAAKARVTDRYLSGEKNLIDTGGVKFGGKTFISSNMIKNFADKIGDSKTYNFLSTSDATAKVRNFFNTIFNPRYVGGKFPSEVPKDFMDSYYNWMNINSSIPKKSIDKAVKFLGKDLTPEEAGQFFDLANKGIPKRTEGIPEGISEKSYNLYNKHLNEWRPEHTARAKQLGLKNELDNYIRNYYPEVANFKEKYATAGKPIKEFKPGSFKKRLTDEEWVKGFFGSQGMNEKEINKFIKGNKEKVSEMADQLRRVRGLSTDPYLALAQEEAELSIKENTHKFITDTINKYGKRIKPDEVADYKNAGYGTYYPTSPLRFYPTKEGVGVAKSSAYAFENPAIANWLNKFSTDINQNSLIRGLNYASNKMINIYFFHPQSVFYHGLHNVAYNTWLAGGIRGFDNITRAAENVAKETPLYQRAVKAGAFLPEFEKGTLKEVLDRELNRTPQAIKDTANLFNPLNRNHLMNRLFQGTDKTLRMNLFMNALGNAATDSKAADFVNHFAGNYKDLTETEKQYFRILYPYYSWFKTNVKANFGAWATNPERQLIPQKVWNALNEAWAGRPMWKNAPGASWKIATGQRDKNGREIYVNPSVAGNIVPELINDPKSLVTRMASGPVVQGASLALTGKTPYELLTGSNPPAAMPGAPISEVLKRIGMTGLPYEMQKSFQKPNADLLELLTGWDKSNPLWENIVQSIVGASLSTPITASKKASIENKQRAQYLRALFRARSRS